MSYTTVGESISALIMTLLLFFMIYTKPRKTFAYGVLFSGVIFALVESILALFLGRDYEFFYVSYAGNAMRALLGGLYALFHVAIVCHIYTYLSTLVTREQRFRKRTAALCIIYAVLFYVLGGVVSFLGYLDIRDALSVARFCAVAGIIASVYVVLEGMRNSRYMSRVVRLTLLIFVPFELLLLVLQSLATQWIFLGLSYAIPLTLFYLLFHSNPFDEMTGTQNVDSLDNYLTRLIAGHQGYLVLLAEFPQLRKANYLSGETTVRRVMIDVCQRTERISPKLTLFRLNDDTFAAVVPVREEGEAKQILDEILDAMEGVNHFGRFRTYYKAVAIRRFPEIMSLRQFYAFYGFLQERLGTTQESECFMATQSMLDKFQRDLKIRETLEDIRDRGDIADERVLCYAQAIYSVKNETFRTAESLMRLQVGDEIVSPVDFIPVAEEMHCIHDLTRVMLFKVCRAVKELEREHDFDGVTINCSASEFMDRELHRELLSIIDESKIDHKHVRFEITESSMGDQYDSVLYNMEKMNEAGIMFYLDDFGTGYSNLERILTCPFDTIKFDKSMLYKGMQDKAMDSIVTTMVDVLKESDKVMLVEGVETEAQCSYSIDRGFDFIQGFKYAKPQPIEKLRNYFEKK